ncbi:hypothetical protein B0H13DRAFT_1856797 [Mycena leptocephala]|nr:hypothetical protein B0H13DRAFT_1856797 [Mycena leptocephala]
MVLPLAHRAAAGSALPSWRGQSEASDVEKPDKAGVDASTLPVRLSMISVVVMLGSPSRIDFLLTPNYKYSDATSVRTTCNWICLDYFSGGIIDNGDASNTRGDMRSDALSALNKFKPTMRDSQDIEWLSYLGLV